MLKIFFWNLFPSTPAEMVKINTPITPKATREQVVVIPNLAKRPFASIEAHISVTNAGKCAVMILAENHRKKTNKNRDIAWVSQGM